MSNNHPECAPCALELCAHTRGAGGKGHIEKCNLSLTKRICIDDLHVLGGGASSRIEMLLSSVAIVGNCRLSPECVARSAYGGDVLTRDQTHKAPFDEMPDPP